MEWEGVIKVGDRWIEGIEKRYQKLCMLCRSAFLMQLDVGSLKCNDFVRSCVEIVCSVELVLRVVKSTDGVLVASV